MFSRFGTKGQSILRFVCVSVLRIVFYHFCKGYSVIYTYSDNFYMGEQVSEDL